MKKLGCDAFLYCDVCLFVLTQGITTCPGLASDSSCLSLLSAENIRVCHLAWLEHGMISMVLLSLGLSGCISLDSLLTEARNIHPP